MEKYNKYKNIISGAKSMVDINFIKKNIGIDNDIIFNTIIKSHNYDDKIGCHEMINICNKLDEMKYFDECKKYLEYYSYKFDTTQNEVITKILSSKKNTITYIDLPLVEKQCPHCGKINKARFDTTYIVCGVDPSGIVPIDNYDNYCLKDWCFQCGKKLCKSWYEDRLFDVNNRIHDDNCCRNHAKANDYKYPEEYCQCIQTRTSDNCDKLNIL